MRTLVFCPFSTVFVAMAGPQGYKPKSGLLPHSKTAIAVAEAVLAPFSGEQEIACGRPFRATLGKGI